MIAKKHKIPVWLIILVICGALVIYTWWPYVSRRSPPGYNTVTNGAVMTGLYTPTTHYLAGSVSYLSNGTLLRATSVGGSDENGYWKPEESDLTLHISSDDGRNWESTTLIQHTQYWGVGDASLLVAGDGTIFLRYTRYKGFLTEAKIYIRCSRDNGKTWSEDIAVDTGHEYNTGSANGIQTRDGDLIFPISWLASENPLQWDASTIISKDNGQSWQTGGVATRQGGLDEPTICELRDGSLLMLSRPFYTDQQIYQSVSRDNGLTWGTPERTSLHSIDSPAFLLRVSFDPDIILLAWNSSPEVKRIPLSVACSKDGGGTWSAPITIVNQGYYTAYPSMAYSVRNKSVFICWWDNPRAGVDRSDWEVIRLSRLVR